MSLLQKLLGVIVAIGMTTLFAYVIASPSCRKHFNAEPGSAIMDVEPSSAKLQVRSESMSQYESVLQNNILTRDNTALPVEYVQLAYAENESLTLGDSTLKSNNSIVNNGSGSVISGSTSSNNLSTVLPVTSSSTSVSSGASSGSSSSTGSESSSSGSGSSGGGSAGGSSVRRPSGGLTGLTGSGNSDLEDSILSNTDLGQDDDKVPPGLNFEYLNSKKFKLEKVLPLMEPLPKPHYSFGISYALFDSDELIFHMTRITHTTNIFASDVVDYNRIAHQIRVCNEINMTGPDIECSIGITYSPWHYALKQGFDLSMPPLPDSEEWNWSLGKFEAKMVMLKDAISQANDKYGCNIRVGNINFDTEIWRKWFGDGTYSNQEYISRMAACLDAFTDKSKEIFPNVEPSWFGRAKSFWGTGFDIVTNPFWTGQEKTDHPSPYLYSVGNVRETDELVRQNCLLTKEMECTKMIPFLALGCGYPRNEDAYAPWSFTWDYELEASYQMGERLSRQSFTGDINNDPDYSMVEAAIFYPRPLDTRAKHWSKHFAAYVMGATMTEVYE